MVSALTQNSSDIISLLDAQGRLVYNSAATERINGYKPEELVGVDTFEFMHPDDRAAVAETFQAVLATPGSVHTVPRSAARRRCAARTGQSPAGVPGWPDAG